VIDGFVSTRRADKLSSDFRVATPSSSLSTE